MTNIYGDNAISSPYIDIYSFHDYQFGPYRYAGLQYQVEVMQDSMLEQLGHYKPILLSETDNGKDGGPRYLTRVVKKLAGG